MDEEAENYMRSIGMGDVFVERARFVEGLARSVLPEQIEKVFVSEISQQDGSRQYDKLHFFTRSFAVEAAQFLTDDRLDMDVIKNSIHNLLITSSNFDMENATPESRLSVTYGTYHGLHCQLAASRENCVSLMTIVRERLIPNFCNEAAPRQT